MYLVFKHTPTNHVHFYAVVNNLDAAEKYKDKVKSTEMKERYRVSDPYPYFGEYLNNIYIMKVKEE